MKLLIITILVMMIIAVPVSAVMKVYNIKCPNNSMYPAIKCPSRVLINESSNAYKDVRLNDIVLYKGDLIVHADGRKEQYLILHRIVGAMPFFFITKGDNNAYIDFFVPKKNVIGRYVKTI